MPSNRLEEIRERVRMCAQMSHYSEITKCEANAIVLDIPYLLDRLRLAEAVVEAGRVVSPDYGNDARGFIPLFKSLTAYDAFLSASNPEAGEGRMKRCKPCKGTGRIPFAETAGGQIVSVTCHVCGGRGVVRPAKKPVKTGRK